MIKLTYIVVLLLSPIMVIVGVLHLITKTLDYLVDKVVDKYRFWVKDLSGMEWVKIKPGANLWEQSITNIKATLNQLLTILKKL